MQDNENDFEEFEEPRAVRPGPGLRIVAAFALGVTAVIILLYFAY